MGGAARSSLFGWRAERWSIEGRHLRYQLKKRLSLDALISLPKLPPGWDQADMT